MANLLSKIILIKFLIFLNVVIYNVAVAENLSLKGDFTQGGIIRGKANPGTKIYLDKVQIKVSKEGWFIFGFGRDYKKSANVDLILINGSKINRKFIIKSRDWQVQRINGLPDKMVSPSKEHIKRIKEEASEVFSARNNFIDKLWFLDSFSMPVEGKITGVYGTKRILNGKNRQPHYGIDIAAPKGKEVLAPANGFVRLVARDYYFSGGTLILDHGYGLSSTFMHLEYINVKKGEIIKKGTVIGLVGNTGRSTGPHLDWRMNWFNIRVDPMLIVNQ